METMRAEERSEPTEEEVGLESNVVKHRPTRAAVTAALGAG